MLNAIYNFFGTIILFFYELFGNNYTLAILIFTLICQIILLPFGIKQQKNSVKQAKLAPKIMAIRNKYKGRTDKATQQKMQEETMDLYQRENYNPASGCLPLLIQLPIILLLYNVIRSPLEFILKYSAETMEAVKGVIENAGQTVAVVANKIDQLDLAHKMVELGEEKFAAIDLGGRFPHFTLFGLDLTQTPLSRSGGFEWTWLLLIPVLTFVAMMASQMIIKKFTYQSPEVKDQQNSASMKIMNLVGPLMSGYFAAVWPATLGIYWIIRNIFQTIQQIALTYIIPVPKFTEEDYKKAERELAGKAPKKEKTERDPNKPRPRSLHYIDEEDEEYPDIPSASVENDPEPVEDVTEPPVTELNGSAVAPAPIKNDEKGSFSRHKNK